MIIYHIEFAKTGMGLSGGEKCMIENIKYFQSVGIENVLLTNDNGRYTYERLGLKANEYLTYKTVNSHRCERYFGVFISYLIRTFRAIKLVKTLNPSEEDALICHSEFFPNSIPFYVLAKKNTKTKLIYWFHMLAPRIFRGYEGEFLNRFQVPRANIIHYRLNQWLYRLLCPPRTVILTVNNYYLDYLTRKYPRNRAYAIKYYGGVSVPKYSVPKKYDAIWMGRFHPQKGIFELLDIIKRLKSTIPNIQVIVLGGGNRKIETGFKKCILKTGLQGNITFKGHITGDEKYKFMHQSKIFLMTSYFESFGQVNLEAMKCGLPVVAYDLPVFHLFTDGFVKVPILDNHKFAKVVSELLANPDSYHRLTTSALQFASQFSWKRTGDEIYSILHNES